MSYISLCKRNIGHKYLTYVIDLQGLYSVNSIKFTQHLLCNRDI